MKKFKIYHCSEKFTLASIKTINDLEEFIQFSCQSKNQDGDCNLRRKCNEYKITISGV
jgi:hypothetical protein